MFSGSLDSVLKRHARAIHAVPAGADELGERPPVPTAALFNADAFRRDLDALRRTNLWNIVAIVAIVIVLGVIVGILINQNLGNPAVVTSLFVGFGTIAVGLTTVVGTMFKILGQSQFLRILSNHLDGQTAQTMVDILSKRL